MREANRGEWIDVAIDFVGAGRRASTLAAQTVPRGGAIIVAGGGGGRLCLEAKAGVGRAPEREVTIMHTFGGSRGDLVEALALAEAGHVHSTVQQFALEDAAAALAELEAGRVMGRAVIVPGA